jgi:septum formation protein
MSTAEPTVPAPIILASQSAIRGALLRAACVPFEAKAPRIDEDSVRASLTADSIPPRDQADAIAELKAARLSKRNPAAFVIGCDQVLSFEGQVFAKAGSREVLHAQLERLSGNPHELYAAVVIYEAGQPVWRHVGRARMTMHALSPEFLDGYLDRNWERVRYSVGGYHVEEEGVRLFERIEGSYFDVLGLPLPELLSYLTQRKVIEI